MTGTNSIFFGTTNEGISSSTVGQTDIDALLEIELDAPLIEIREDIDVLGDLNVTNSTMLNRVNGTAGGIVQGGGFSGMAIGVDHNLTIQDFTASFTNISTVYLGSGEGVDYTRIDVNGYVFGSPLGAYNWHVKVFNCSSSLMGQNGAVDPTGNSGFDEGRGSLTFFAIDPNPSSVGGCYFVNVVENEGAQSAKILQVMLTKYME